MTEANQVDADELVLLRQRNEALEVSLKEVRDRADKRLLHVELKAEAIKCGMVDLDGLKLIDSGAVTIDDDGNVRGAAAVMARMRRDKPWLFTPSSSASISVVPAQVAASPKLATDMTLAEWRAARADLLRRR